VGNNVSINAESIANRSRDATRKNEGVWTRVPCRNWTWNMDPAARELPYPTIVSEVDKEILLSKIQCD
jgi:hypothetical protein